MRTGDGTANWKWKPGSQAPEQPRRDSRQFSSRRHRGIVGIETIWLIEISSEVLCARIVSLGGACVSWIYGNGKAKWHWINNKKENEQQAIRRHRNRNRNRNRYRWESSAIRKRLTLSGPWLMTIECVAPQAVGTAAKKLQRGANPDGATARNPEDRANFNRVVLQYQHLRRLKLLSYHRSSIYIGEVFTPQRNTIYSFKQLRNLYVMFKL